MRAELIIMFIFLSTYSAQRYQAPRCYRPNEELRCVLDCPPERSCKNRIIRYRCDIEGKQCQQKCVCKMGYVRNPAGDCIPESKCDMCKGPNEYFACGSACDTECAHLHQYNKTYGCPIVNVVCNEKCYCEDGFARNSQNICVPESQCAPKCGKNEVYNINKTSCPPEVCFSIIAFFNCAANQPFVPGCSCKPGYLRKELTSPCIPIKECPELANSPDFKN